MTGLFVPQHAAIPGSLERTRLKRCGDHHVQEDAVDQGEVGQRSAGLSRSCSSNYPYRGPIRLIYDEGRTANDCS